MTLIIGIICKDGIVLSADSQTTRGAARQLGTNKISIIDFENTTVAVAESGSASLSNAAIDTFQRLAKSRKAENDFDVARTAEEAVREIVRGITKHLNPSPTDRERQEFLFEPTNYFELMVAYYFGTKPHLYTVNPAWCVPVRAKSHFLTSGIASDLANYILSEHTAPKLDANFASIIAVKTVMDAVDHVEGCGRPIRLAVVRKPYRYREIKPGQTQEQRGLLEILTEPPLVSIYQPKDVDRLERIIEKVESDTKGRHYKSIHKALKVQSERFHKEMMDVWKKFREDFPEEAAKHEARLESARISGELRERQILNDED